MSFFFIFLLLVVVVTKRIFRAKLHYISIIPPYLVIILSFFVISGIVMVTKDIKLLNPLN